MKRDGIPEHVDFDLVRTTRPEKKFGGGGGGGRGGDTAIFFCIYFWNEGNRVSGESITNRNFLSPAREGWFQFSLSSSTQLALLLLYMLPVVHANLFTAYRRKLD